MKIQEIKHQFGVQEVLITNAWNATGQVAVFDEYVDDPTCVADGDPDGVWYRHYIYPGRLMMRPGDPVPEENRFVVSCEPFCSYGPIHSEGVPSYAYDAKCVGPGLYHVLERDRIYVVLSERGEDDDPGHLVESKTPRGTFIIGQRPV